jgi:hypothetical protein
MKESAQAALSLLKSRAETLGINPELFKKHDLHIHIPAGAIPKDGPSAGITLFVTLVSLLTDRRVSHDIAMTGRSACAAWCYRWVASRKRYWLRKSRDFMCSAPRVEPKGHRRNPLAAREEFAL